MGRNKVRCQQAEKALKSQEFLQLWTIFGIGLSCKRETLQLAAGKNMG